MDDKVKELLDRIRDTAEGAADAANQTPRAAGKRAGQMGQVMYDAHRGQREEGDKVSELLERADVLSARISDLKERISALRQSRACPACGAVCGKEDQFCRRCGAGL